MKIVLLHWSERQHFIRIFTQMHNTHLKRFSYVFYRNNRNTHAFNMFFFFYWIREPCILHNDYHTNK